VVAQALQVAGDQDHAAGPLQGPVVGRGPLDLAEHLAVQPVQRLVEDGQALGQLQVTPGEAGHGRGHHPLGVAAHLGQGGLDPGDGRVVLGDADELGHVHAQVAHPLDVRVDVQHPGDQAQVPGHRRLQGQGAQDLLFDLDVGPVDLVVADDDLVRQGGVEAGQGLERAVELALDELAHLEQLGLQPLQALFEGGAHVRTPWPVAGLTLFVEVIVRAGRTRGGPGGGREGNGR
jgi:hypothetical protein